MSWQFKKMEASDVDILLPFFELRPTDGCDSTLFDSFLWKEYYHAEFCIRDQLALEWKMKLHGEVFAALPMCKAEDLVYYFKDIEAYFNQELGMKLRLYGADQQALKILQLSEEEYTVREEFDEKDYLYDADALRRLPGKKYHKKKNHVNAFIKEYEGRYEYRTLGCENKQDMWRMLDKWRLMKGDAVEEHLSYEVEGIHNVLNTCARLGARMGGVYIDGALEAFTMGSYNKSKEMAVVHIEKANPQIRGLYPFINQQFLIHEFPEAKIVNREDDLGMPGLRKAKESYHPIGYARRYSIFQK